MLNEHQKRAYAILLQKAQQAAQHTKEEILSTMHRAIDAASEKEAELAHLSREELEKVKQTLKADLDAISRYFAEVGEGIEEILTMDAAYLEEKFLEISEQLADPTVVQLARMRLLAAVKGAQSR